MGVSLCKVTRLNAGANEEGFERLIERVRLLETLKAIAFSDICDYVTFEEGGMRARPFEEIPPMKLHALKNLKTDERGMVVSIELRNKSRALGMLLKITGGIKSRMDLTNGV
jgi:hypothetical protein